MGVSGSGKTTLARELFEKLPVSALFINTQGKDIRGTQIKKPSDLKKLLYYHVRGRKVKGVLSPSIFDNQKSYTKKVKTAIRLVFHTQRLIYHKGVVRTFFIFIDEVQNLTRDQELKELVADLSLMGRNIRTFGVFTTQRPQNLPKDLFTQSNLMFGNLEEFDREYLRRLYIDVPSHVHPHEFWFYERVTGNRRESFILRI